MESLLRLALVQMDVDAGNPDANYARLEIKLNEAVQGPVKPDMVMLPEMWNTGYALEQIDELAYQDGERTKALLSAFSRNHKVQIFGGSIAGETS